MSIIAGGKDSKPNVCSHCSYRTSSPWPSGLTRSQNAATTWDARVVTRVRVGVSLLCVMPNLPLIYALMKMYVRDLHLINLTLIYATREARVVSL